MGRLSSDCVAKLEGISLFRLFPGADGDGRKGLAQCPMCGADGRGKHGKARKLGLAVVDDGKKRLVKCSACGFGAGGSAVNVVMKMEGLGFREACVRLADMTGVQLEYEDSQFAGDSVRAGDRAGAVDGSAADWEGSGAEVTVAGETGDALRAGFSEKIPSMAESCDGDAVTAAEGAGAAVTADGAAAAAADGDGNGAVTAAGAAAAAADGDGNGAVTADGAAAEVTAAEGAGAAVTADGAAAAAADGDGNGGRSGEGIADGNSDGGRSGEGSREDGGRSGEGKVDGLRGGLGRRRAGLEGGEPREGSFVARQLRESGLEPADVMARVRGVDGEWMEVCPFRKGKLDVVTGQVTEWGDEMIISYFGLEGERKMTVPAKNRSREVGYNRVRWQNPEAHLDRRGKAVKYQSIMGSSIELFFPERVRRMYLDSVQFDTLFIQEGEKKAEKASKHGLLSVGIQGISNFGSNERGLPDEVQYLVQRCGVRNVVFVMDADWNDLASSIEPDESVDRRPKAFANALIKFRNQVRTLGLCGLDVDIWWGHVNRNEAGDKGVDDLLANSLRGREDELAADVERAWMAHDGRGEWITLRNVTSWSDYRVMGLWSLNSADDFFAAHRERLEGLRSFQFQGVMYSVAEGRIQVSTEYGEGKLFWSVSIDEKGRRKVDVDLIDMRSFLHVNGYRSFKNEEGKRVLVRVEKGVIHFVDEYDVRDYVLSFVFKATKERVVHQVFAESIDSRLSMPKLLQMQLLVTNAGRPTADAQRFYYRDRQLKISSGGIEVTKLSGPVWEENLIKRTFERERIFDVFEPDGRGSFRVRLTDAGRESEFLAYLMRTCDMWGGRERTAQQESEFWRHVANRITAIGYLLRDYRDMGEDKAVVSMDATMVEVGVNNGRSGKSLIGKALAQMVSQAYIEGPNLENNDQFIFTEVRKTTRNVFLDDIKQEFDMTRFKSRITGDLNVNVKQGGRFVIPYEESPKFYLTSNHALDGLDPSCRARIVFMSFSSWYHDGYSPETEFGHLFFAEWDDRQWQLFDNLMAECVMIYIRSAEGRWGAPNKGLVAPPMEDIDRRTYRQEMGESFLAWAELYFSPGSGNLDCRIVRKKIYEAYLSEYGIKSTQMTAKTFRNKLIAFCRYAGLHLNAHRPAKDGSCFADHFSRNPGVSFIGERDVTGSTEYYTLSTLEGLVRSEMG